MAVEVLCPKCKKVPVREHQLKLCDIKENDCVLPKLFEYAGQDNR